MSEPFLAEIKIVSFNFPPKGWALCNGQLLPINQNQALFSLLGTTYGGNGQTNFGLPDFRGRTPVHVGGNHTQGEKAGEEAHTLNLNELPSHSHNITGTTADADRKTPAASSLAYAAIDSYASSNAVVPLHSQAITNNTGGSQPHLNMQPYLTLNFVIALQGIFPSRN
jgi:microcystin-dependent protein